VDRAADLLERAYRRHFVHREVDGKKVGYIFDHVASAHKTVRYIPARFYDRLEELSMYGDWDAIPAEVREEISGWWLREYAAKIAPVVENIKKDPDAYQQIKQKDFLLLEEALAQVAAAECHAVVNCDCRSSTQGCSRMVESCIRLDDGARYTLERGLGRAVSREECQQIVLATDREGLMHIGTRQWQGHGLFGFCNCCTCCCFPLRASRLLGSDRVYPRVHFRARRRVEDCTHCGLCAKRCPYGAFHRDGTTVQVKGKARRAVGFDPAKCYGCGLCMTGCPEGCIDMAPLEGL
jgi:NAD-dependent dihydropyrimidine dehydrogenase PreA subunit